MSRGRLAVAVELLRLAKVELDDAREALRKSRRRFNDAMTTFMRESLRDATLRLVRRSR